MSRATRRRRAAAAKARKRAKSRATDCEPCGKKALHTQGDAMALITGGRSGVRVYECPSGNGWHTTSRARL